MRTNERLLRAAAEVLEAELRLVFDEGLESEQRDVVLGALASAEAYGECCYMLDDMEARMGVDVRRARELVKRAAGDDDDEPSTYQPEAAVLYDGTPGSGSWRR